MTEGSNIYTTEYLDGFQYYKGVLQFFPHAEGYVKNTVLNGQNTYDYVYNYTDHLGNIRVSYTKDPETGEIAILEENHYFPFGLKHADSVTHTERIEPNAIIDNIALKVYNAVEKTSGNAGVINVDISTNVSDNSATASLQLNTGVTQTSYSIGSEGIGMGGNISAFDAGLGTNLDNGGVTLSAFNSGGEGITNSFNVQVKPTGMVIGAAAVTIGAFIGPEAAIIGALSGL